MKYDQYSKRDKTLNFSFLLIDTTAPHPNLSSFHLFCKENGCWPASTGILLYVVFHLVYRILYLSLTQLPQLFFSILRHSQVEAHISTCFADIASWMSAHHLKPSLNNTALLLFPWKVLPSARPLHHCWQGHVYSRTDCQESLSASRQPTVRQHPECSHSAILQVCS